MGQWNIIFRDKMTDTPPGATSSWVDLSRFIQFILDHFGREPHPHTDELYSDSFSPRNVQIIVLRPKI